MVIEKIPSIPNDIISAANEKRLSIFIGAGVSRLIGCHSWSELAHHIIDKCHEEGCINYRQQQRLHQDNNYKKIITVCYSLLKNKGCEEQFFKVLETSLEGNQILLDKKNIYQELSGIPALHITTNADVHFDKFFLNERIVYKDTDFNISNIDRHKLYHIHGSINDRKSLVFLVPQYINKYNKKEFEAFLENIFAKYTVLFLGYGMEEYEVLDFLIRKFNPEIKTELKHFILLPYFKGEEDILEFDSYYFNSMGIKVIGYEKDDIGYNQLFEIIKNWKKEVFEISDVLHNEMEEMDEAIDTL